MKSTRDPVVSNPWGLLRQLTSARIALGRTGISLPTTPQLEFQLAHARARDAVHLEMNAEALAANLQQVLGLPCLSLQSAAATRPIYLQRPDLGRRLHPASAQQLSNWRATNSTRVPYEVAFVVADGLSALAIETNAQPFLQAVLPRLHAENISVAPISLVRQARVAVGDEVGALLGAQLVVVMIGERPGLSSPDSMGLYLTWQPRIGLTDESRNCLSNIRPAGMSYEEAAYKLHYLISEARKRQLSGVQLKDETADANQAGVGFSNFLLKDERADSA